MTTDALLKPSHGLAARARTLAAQAISCLRYRRLCVFCAAAMGAVTGAVPPGVAPACGGALAGGALTRRAATFTADGARLAVCAGAVVRLYRRVRARARRAAARLHTPPSRCRASPLLPVSLPHKSIHARN